LEHPCFTIAFSGKFEIIKDIHCHAGPTPFVSCGGIGGEREGVWERRGIIREWANDGEWGIVVKEGETRRERKRATEFVSRGGKRQSKIKEGEQRGRKGATANSDHQPQRQK
jgi:hypothetical protein